MNKSRKAKFLELIHGTLGIEYFQNWGGYWSRAFDHDVKAAELALGEVMELKRGKQLPFNPGAYLQTRYEQMCR